MRKGHIYTLVPGTATGPVIIPSDRVTKAPLPQDLRGLLLFFSRDKLHEEADEADDVQEFMVECIVAHGKGDDGKDIVRIRWHRYDSTVDTWKPTEDIPPNFVKRYWTWKKIPLFALLLDALENELPTRRISSIVQDDDPTAICWRSSSWREG